MPESLSRREFFKAMGVAGASTVLATASPAVADEMDLVPRPIERKLWWAKAVENPTTGIDWDRIQRFDYANTTLGDLPKYVGAETVKEWNALRAANRLQWEKEGRPGYTTKDMALDAGVNGGRYPLSFLGPQQAATPEERGVAKYEGTPEENARIVTAALRFFGAATVGFVELDGRTEKLIYAVDPDGKRLDFEDVAEGYETDDRRVLPQKARWVIVYTIQMSNETFKRAPTVLGSQASMSGYARQTVIQAQLQEFLRALGYHGYGESSTNALGLALAFGVMAGLGELSRLNRLITPEYGPMVRVFKHVTDLPLAPTKPIDAGIMQFCRRCKKCAEVCVPGALSYETEPSWEVRGGWNNPGHEAYFEDAVLCRQYWYEVGTGCGVCFSACPYAKEDKASIHKIVMATSAATPIFDGVFKSMDDLFYEYEKSPEQWWKTDLPELGIDTTRGHNV